MRLHPNRYDHEQLLEIMADYGAAGAVVDVQCYLGDLDLTDLLESGEVSIGADTAAPWTFSGTFSERLDIDYRNAPMRLVVDISGIELDLLYARASLPIQGDDFSTTIIAGTPGIFLDKFTLDEQVSYSSAPPQNVIRDAVGRIPYYDRGRIVVPAFDTPLITRGLNTGTNETGDSDAFADEDTPAGILASIAAEVDCVYFDTALAGFKALSNPGIGEGIPLSWTYEVGTAEVIDTFSEPTFATPDELVGQVVVRDRYEDGTLRVYEAWPVDYSRLLYPPAATSTMYLPLSDTTPAAFSEARKLAASTAERLRNGTFNGSISVAFNPLIEPYDVISIFDERRDITGRYRRHWQALINGITHTFGAGVSTSLSFIATLVKTERLPELPLRIDGNSSGVASTPLAGFVLGIDFVGEWVDSAHITGPLWSGEDSSEAGDWFDSALAPAGLLGEELVDGQLVDYIEYLSAAGATHGEDDLGEWVDDAFISDPQWAGTTREDFDETALDWFDYDFAPLGLFGEDTSGPYTGLEYIDF